MLNPNSSSQLPIANSPWQSDWAFTAVLWLWRWLVILPINWLNGGSVEEGGAGTQVSGNLLALFLLLVLLDPVVETLLECALPYWIMSKLATRVRPAMFIIISAFCMSVLHIASVMTVINAAITGAFIAGVYARAARRGQSPGIVHGVVFHSAINLVGWLMLFVQ